MYLFNFVEIKCMLVVNYVDVNSLILDIHFDMDMCIAGGILRI